MHALIVFHESCLEHNTGHHCECAERIHVILQAFSEQSSIDIKELKAQSASMEDVLRCHSKKHYEKIAGTHGQSGFIDADTIFSPNTFIASLHAAGAGITALDNIFSDDSNIKSAFLPIRPPGHHSTWERSMGFCFFNNIAIAARYAQAKNYVKRILIVDIDVHHGNGTQDIFYEDDSVFYYSLHLWPHYPGTGSKEETGRGKGEKTTLNRPLPHGFANSDYVLLFQQDITNIFNAYSPELVLVSAGFDSHRQDQLGGLDLVEDDFYSLGQILRDNIPGGPIISFLEGGYNLTHLGSSALAFLRGITAGAAQK